MVEASQCHRNLIQFLPQTWLPGSAGEEKGQGEEKGTRALVAGLAPHFAYSKKCGYIIHKLEWATKWFKFTFSPPVSCPASSFSFSSAGPQLQALDRSVPGPEQQAQDQSDPRRTSTASTRSQCSAGPEQQPLDQSVPRRTSTASSGSEYSPPDLHRKLRINVFPLDLNRELRIRVFPARPQPQRLSEDIPDRMPERMSKDMPDRMPEKMSEYMSEQWIRVGITRRK